jgi:hypothetical protein
MDGSWWSQWARLASNGTPDCGETHVEELTNKKGRTCESSIALNSMVSRRVITIRGEEDNIHIPAGYSIQLAGFFIIQNTGSAMQI